MSEMFTKIGGYIASGDPLVYSDSATMTGDGTVASPFGIKASDLYVQEPLFTGTSGTSAYIGWRPDETVLWSGNDFTPAGSNNPVSTSVSLSENFNNFNQIRLDFSNGEFFTESVLLTEPTTARKCFICIKKEQSNNGVYVGTHYKFTSNTTLSGYCSYGDSQNINAMTGGYWGYGGVVRVVGINRKLEA